MKTRLIPTLGLIALLLVSCSPPAAQTEAETTQTDLPATLEGSQVVSDSAQPVAVATSRGPDLEATDPATVSLASGDLQLVEFFRFT